MSSLLMLSANVFTGDEDQQLVSGDVAASPENIQSSRMWWAFDDTEEEAITSVEVPIPSQYTGSGLVAIVYGFFKTETSNNALIEVFVEAKTSNSDTLDMGVADSFAAGNTGALVPGGTAGDPVSKSIALTADDGMVAGDSVRFGVRRDTDGAGDTASGDFCVTAIEIADGG